MVAELPSVQHMCRGCVSRPRALLVAGLIAILLVLIPLFLLNTTAFSNLIGGDLPTFARRGYDAGFRAGGLYLFLVRGTFHLRPWFPQWLATLVAATEYKLLPFFPIVFVHIAYRTSSTSPATAAPFHPDTNIILIEEPLLAVAPNRAAVIRNLPYQEAEALVPRLFPGCKLHVIGERRVIWHAPALLYVPQERIPTEEEEAAELEAIRNGGQ